MKRTLTTVLLLALSLSILPPLRSARAQQTVFVPNCSGVNDTAAFSSIISAVGSNAATIRLPYKAGTRCAVNNLTVPANVTLDNTDGTGIKVNTGQTLTIVGPLSSPPGKRFFYNALAGQGTVSFASNARVALVFPQWWGYGDGTGSDSAASTAATTAASTAANPVAVGVVGTQTVSMTARSTGGDGSAGSPYTGWDAAGFASSTAYTFDAGKYYSYSTPIVIQDTTATRLASAGGGPAFLKFTGTGKALTFKSTALGGHFYSGIENLTILGNASATEGLYTEAVHHMRVVNVSVRDVSQKCFHFKFAVLNHYDTLQCSETGNPMTVHPVNGLYTEARGGGETFQANTLTNLIIEHMSGDGVILNDAWQNLFNGGTSEGNGGSGFYLTSNSKGNVFTGTDAEANGGASDWDISGHFNRLENVLSDKLIVIRSGSRKNVVRGGQINSLTIESGALYPYIENINYNLGGTGTLTLNEPTTTVWGVFTDIGSGGSGGGNVIVANPVNFATTSTGPSWDTTTFNVINIGGAAALFTHKATSNPGVNAPLNAYFGSGSWRYRVTGLRATNYAQQAGVHTFQTATSGTADAALTWTDVLTIGANGAVTFDSGTATATAGAATLNKQTGTITSEALTTAAGSDYVLTLTNSLVSSSSHVYVSADNGTNTTEGLSVQRVSPGSGSVVIRVRNTHASAALNGTIKISFSVF